MVPSKTGRKRASWGWACLAATGLGAALIAAIDLVDLLGRDGERATLTATAANAEETGSGSSAAPRRRGDEVRRQRLLWALLPREIGGHPLGSVR